MKNIGVKLLFVVLGFTIITACGETEEERRAKERARMDSLRQVQQQQIAEEMARLEEEKTSDNFYEFEPQENEILDDLLPRNISTQIFKAFLENAASEQGSRMTAMDSATRNARDLVDKLTITYNRSRQATITKELIEIISGAESL